MLPQTRYVPDKMLPHEGINDLPVHPATIQQLFWPTTESKHFTREDAGKVFNEHLLPADMRIPHPEMVQKVQLETASARSMRMKLETWLKERDEQEHQKKNVVDDTLTTLNRGKWAFKIEDVNIDATVGKNGRGRKGVGWRYGMPFDDRKRAIVKIPTSVP
jgi:hypothetical protein